MTSAAPTLARTTATALTGSGTTTAPASMDSAARTARTTLTTARAAPATMGEPAETLSTALPATVPLDLLGQDVR